VAAYFPPAISKQQNHGEMRDIPVHEEVLAYVEHLSARHRLTPCFLREALKVGAVA
jgi:hypothetical protein